MSKVLLAWELGDNYGHIAKMQLLAQGLRARGHEVVALFKDIGAGTQIMDFPVLQAPVWPAETRGFPEPPLSYPEILLRFGYHDISSLQTLAAGWLNAYRLWQPDLIVADHAPTALLAARSAGIPAAVIGEGFTVPPRLNPLPNMRPWLNVPLDRLVNADQRVTEIINAVLGKLGGQPVASVTGLFDVAARILTTFPELDHYPMRTGEDYQGAQYFVERGENIQWPQQGRGKVFVYLRQQHREFLRIMELLDAMDFCVVASVPGLTQNVRELFDPQRILVTDRHYRLASLQDCDFAITYGGHGMAAALLMQGVPQLVFPTHLEQYLLAGRVEQLGAGIAVNPEQQPALISRLLRKMRDQDDCKRAAQAFAAKHITHDCDAAMRAIVQRLESLMQS